jgi:hypothetical protein
LALVALQGHQVQLQYSQASQLSAVVEVAHQGYRQPMVAQVVVLMLVVAQSGQALLVRVTQVDSLTFQAQAVAH